MTPRFDVGDRVRIADRHEDRHNRTPRYVRGKAGVVERVCGAFGEPELLAYGRYGDPSQTLYRVRLAQTDITLLSKFSSAVRRSITGTMSNLQNTQITARTLFKTRAQFIK